MTNTVQASIVTVVLSDGSEVYDLILSQGDDQIQIPMGSLNGAMDVVACMNNHMIAPMHVSEVTV